MTDFIHVARTFERILVSMLSRDIGLHFFISLLSLLFFSINVIIACLWDGESSPSSKAAFRLSKSG